MLLICLLAGYLTECRLCYHCYPHERTNTCGKVCQLTASRIQCIELIDQKEKIQEQELKKTLNDQEKTIIDIVVDKLGVLEAHPESILIDDLGADSLDGVEIVMELEDRFKIEIQDEEFENVKTIKDIFDLIKKKN